MTTDLAAGSPPGTEQRKFSSIFFAPKGDGTRRRRGTDVSRVVASILIVLFLGLLLSSHERIQTELTKALHPPAQGISWLVTVLWDLGSAGAIVLVIAVAVLDRRMEILRDLAVAAGTAFVTCVALQHLLGVTANFPSSASTDLQGVNLGFPVPLLSVSVGVVVVSLPYFSRGLQRLLEGLIFVSLLSGLMHGVGLPVSLIGSVVVGWGAAAVVHLAFGSPIGIPATADVSSLLGSLGVTVRSVTPARRQDWGLVRYDAQGSGGTPLRISLYGRDARESQLFAKLYRTIFLRDDAGPFSLTRAQQVEHEGYMTLLASVAAPNQTARVVASGFAPADRSAMVVSEIPRGESLRAISDTGGTVSDAALDSLVVAVHALHQDNLTQGSLDLDRIVLDGDHAGIFDFNHATTFGSSQAIHRETAALLMCMALVAGADRAIAACTRTMGIDALSGALPFLQDVALPSGLVATIRVGHHKPLLAELRTKGAAAADVEVPKLAELHRVSWTNLILAVGTLIGGWALIGVFLHVAQAWSTIANGDLAWVIATAVVAQLAYLGSGLSTMGSVTTALPLWPVVVLELSNTFSGLALGTPAVLAARIRFFQKQGISTTVAVSSGVLVSTASWIVKGGLFLISIPFALGTIHFSTLTKSSSGGSDQTLLLWIMVIVLGIGIAVTGIFAVPRWRRMVAARVVPQFHEAVSHFKTLIDRPVNMVEIFGGMMIAQLVTAFALSAALMAYGYHLSLPVILVVLTIGSMLGGVSPVPGGMGVVEAGMILGLKAAGVPSDAAVAAVFVQRLFTAYLPPVAGWFCLMWLRRKDYL